MSTKKPTPGAETPESAVVETPEGAAPVQVPEATDRPETPEAHRDVVAAVSYRADGTPDQAPGFVVLGESD